MSHVIESVGTDDQKHTPRQSNLGDGIYTQGLVAVGHGVGMI